MEGSWHYQQVIEDGPVVLCTFTIEIAYSQPAKKTTWMPREVTKLLSNCWTRTGSKMILTGYQPLIAIQKWRSFGVIICYNEKTYLIRNDRLPKPGAAFLRLYHVNPYPALGEALPAQPWAIEPKSSTWTTTWNHCFLRSQSAEMPTFTNLTLLHAKTQP